MRRVKIKVDIHVLILSLFVLLDFNVMSQEFMHWKFLEGEKTDKIKTQTVWQYPESDSSSVHEKTLFSFNQFDIEGRLIALRMYFEDTTYFEYDSVSVYETRKIVHSRQESNADSITVFRYSQTGKLLYELQDGENGYEYYYFYDSLDRQVRMIVAPAKNDIFNQDTIINTTVYNRSGKDSIIRSFEGGVLMAEYFYTYDENLYCIEIKVCDYSMTPSCDSVIYRYNDLGQKIYSRRWWTGYNDTIVRIEERKWEYDRKGRMIMAEDNVSICRWKYNLRGYVKEAKRYNKPAELKFFAKFEYTFWKRRDYRKRNMKNGIYSIYAPSQHSFFDE